MHRRSFLKGCAATATGVAFGVAAAPAQAEPAWEIHGTGGAFGVGSFITITSVDASDFVVGTFEVVAVRDGGSTLVLGSQPAGPVFASFTEPAQKRPIQKRSRRGLFLRTPTRELAVEVDPAKEEDVQSWRKLAESMRKKFGLG